MANILFITEIYKRLSHSVTHCLTGTNSPAEDCFIVDTNNRQLASKVSCEGSVKEEEEEKLCFNEDLLCEAHGEYLPTKLKVR